MQAIITKVLLGTNTLPTRMKAECSAKSIVLSKNSVEDCTIIPPPNDQAYTHDAYQHRKLAWNLVQQLEWTPKAMHTGDLPNGDYVHVLTY